MPPSKPDDAAKDLLKALAELRDAAHQLQDTTRSIEDSARRLVQSVRTRTDHRAEFAPVRAADFTGLDLDFYARTERELAAAGVRVLGDYEDAAFNRRSPNKRSFYRLGLSDDGTVAASWFVYPAPQPIRCLVLHSWCGDGRVFVTMRGGSESNVPPPPWLHTRRLAAETGTADAVRSHRERVAAAAGAPRSLAGGDELLAARTAEEAMIAEFRSAQGLELFEPMLRKMLGDKFEKRGRPLLDAIRRHPEWWTGEQPAPSGGGPDTRPDGSPIGMFLRSRERDGDRAHLTTFGLTLHGLPELQMKRVAANHCRAARFLMDTVARKLLAHVAQLAPSDEPLERRISDVEFPLSRADVSRRGRFVMPGRYPETDEQGPVRVRLVLEGFTRGSDRKRGMLSGLLTAFRSDPELLHVTPPRDHAGTNDAWLRESCRRLGHDAPPPRRLDELETQMQVASRKARETLAEWRERFRSGLPPDQALAIKVGLATTAGRREFVWVRVTDWLQDGTIVGTLESKPRDCPGYECGREMRIAEAEVFDRAFYERAHGMVEHAPTDIVAAEFGIDLQAGGTLAFLGGSP